MIVLTIGTQASASTWVFNVVRKIFAIHRPWALSCMGEQAEAALARLGQGTRDAVFKAHAIDQGMVNLLLLSKGKLIASYRDSRDVIVSNDNRFRLKPQDTIRTLSRTLTDILSLPDEIDALHLKYEDRFSYNVNSIKEIASFIGMPISDEQADEIFEILTPEAVTARIDRWICANPDRTETDWERETEWHPRHVGDGLVGKWAEHLAPNIARSATNALDPLYRDEWKFKSITWSPELFNGEAGLFTDSIVDLDVRGDDQMMCWGPYLHLPAGRWRFRPLIESISKNRISIKVDVATFTDGVGVISMKTFTLPSVLSEMPSIEADIADHRRPIEVRIQSRGDGRKGAVRFKGIVAEYIGQSEQMPYLEAFNVSDAD